MSGEEQGAFLFEQVMPIIQRTRPTASEIARKVPEDALLSLCGNLEQTIANLEIHGCRQ